MKVMVMVKFSGADEDQVTPTEEMFAAMGAYNEELVKAGIMLDGEGLRPSSMGAQLVFEGGTTSVVDGSFTEAKEIIGGFWIWEVGSLEEVVEWAKRCPIDKTSGRREVLEVRPIATAEDFGEEFTPELQEREERLAEQLRAQRSGD